MASDHPAFINRLVKRAPLAPRATPTRAVPNHNVYTWRTISETPYQLDTGLHTYLVTFQGSDIRFSNGFRLGRCSFTRGRAF